MRIVYILMVGRMTCYCIYLSYLELLAKSPYRRNMHQVMYCPIFARLWCNVLTRWTQNNHTKLNTREYVERYLTKIYPKESYCIQMERSEWSSWGLFLSFRLRTHRIAPNDECDGGMPATLESTK